MQIDVEKARAETPGVQHRIHFNNCGAGLMPQPVIDALQNHIRLESRIGGYEAENQTRALIEHAYDTIARLIRCTREEVAVVENATRAWDMVFYAFDFEPGDKILTAKAEYASNFIAYLQLARRKGVVVESVPDDMHGQLDVNALERMIDKRVKLISATHVPTNGGLVNPAREIGAVAKKHGVPFLLDACQSVGQLPIDVDDMNIDFLSATSRKYLRGPRGVGFLYVSRSWIDKLEPPFLDLHAADWTSADEYAIRPDARRFENWESHIAGKIGLAAAVDYTLGWGVDAISQRVTSLAEAFRTKLSEIPGVTVQDLGKKKCGIVSFTSDRQSPREIVRRLAEKDINVSASPAKYTRLDMDGRGLAAVVRCGLHYYNTEEEIETCIRELKKIVG